MAKRAEPRDRALRNAARAERLGLRKQARAWRAVARYRKEQEGKPKPG